MNLDDLAATVEEEIKKEEEDLDEYEDSVEAELNTSLSLLEDCHSVMEDILRMKEKRKVSIYLYERLESLSLEVIAFTSQYDVTQKNDNPIDWKQDI